jgi:hypothetical protein
MSGKGSKPRPLSVSTETFDNNWDVIFGKKKKIDEEAVNAYNNERLVSKFDKQNDIVGDSNATSDNNQQR